MHPPELLLAFELLALALLLPFELLLALELVLLMPPAPERLDDAFAPPAPLLAPTASDVNRPLSPPPQPGPEATSNVKPKAASPTMLARHAIRHILSMSA